MLIGGERGGEGEGEREREREGEGERERGQIMCMCVSVLAETHAMFTSDTKGIAILYTVIPLSTQHMHLTQSPLHDRSPLHSTPHTPINRISMLFRLLA